MFLQYLVIISAFNLFDFLFYNFLYIKDLSPSDKCAAVTRLNNALFNPRLHFDCPEPLNGRYLYIKATGVPNRWRRIFTVVLCEVMVY